MRYVLRILKILLLLLLLAAVALWWVSRPLPSSAETLYRGGTILTISGPAAEALLVRDGRIVAVGTEQALKPLLSSEGEVFDLHGGTLMPGLVEPHTHPIATALLGKTVDVSGFSHSSRAEVMTTLREALAKFQPTAWTIAFGWDPVMIADLEPPTLAELDELAPDRPLVILTQMMHDAYANSAALAAAGITADTPAPTGSEFLHDENGELTGTVREVGAIQMLIGAAPKPPEAITTALVQRQLQRYAAAGYTSLGVLGPVGRSNDPLALLARLFKHPAAPLRAQVWALPDQITADMQAGGDNRHALRGVKFWMDGSPFAGGAAWAEPYENSDLVRHRLDLPADHMPHLNFAAEEITDQLRGFHQRGFAIAIHVQGERAVDQALDALETVLNEQPRLDHRYRLEHNALITAVQMQRAADLGVTLSFFVDHVWFYGHRLPELVGASRTNRYMPLATAQQLGHRLSIHGDHPATPINPFRSLHTAVSRHSRLDEAVIANSQALTVAAGLRAMTLDAAWQLGLDSEIGSLEPGKAADLLWLSANPLALPMDQLTSIEVKGTWLVGQPVDTRLWSRHNLGLLWSLLTGS